MVSLSLLPASVGLIHVHLGQEVDEGTHLSVHNTWVWLKMGTPKSAILSYCPLVTKLSFYVNLWYFRIIIQFSVSLTFHPATLLPAPSAEQGPLIALLLWRAPGRRRQGSWTDSKHWHWRHNTQHSSLLLGHLSGTRFCFIARSNKVKWWATTMLQRHLGRESLYTIISASLWRNSLHCAAGFWSISRAFAEISRPLQIELCIRRSK